MQEQRNSMPAWNDYFTQQRCDTCGRTLAPAGIGLGQSASNQTTTQYMDSWTRAWGGMYDAWTQAVTSSWAPFYAPQQQSMNPVGKTHAKRHEEHCEECGRSEGACGHDCECKCCVGDADLLVHARVGERRVVPLVIENDSHREKQIELELSDWTRSAHNGATDIQITGKLLDPIAFTLAGCSEQKVTLMVQILGQAVGTEDAANRGIGDVDGCQVYYADLRVKGCDIRPVRIALALLSRDCSPLTIECRCDCC